MSIIPASVPAPVLPRRRQLLFGTMFVSAAVAMFEFSLVAAPMDSVMSPETAIAFGRMGGLGVLNLEGLWTRYEDR